MLTAQQLSDGQLSSKAGRFYGSLPLHTGLFLQLLISFAESSHLPHHHHRHHLLTLFLSTPPSYSIEAKWVKQQQQEHEEEEEEEEDMDRL